MKYSRLVGDSSRERTFDVTEKFRCGQLFRDGSAIDGHERLIVPCTRAMDQVGNQFFPRTVLSTYQHGHIGYGDQPSTTFHLPNRRAYPLQYVRLLTFRLSGTEQNIVQFRVERFGVDRFGEIVFRTRFHRTDGRRHLRVLRHNDKRNPAFILLHPLQQFDSVAVGQPQIRQNHIDFFVRYDPAGRSRRLWRTLPATAPVPASFSTHGQARHHPRQSIYGSYPHLLRSVGGLLCQSFPCGENALSGSTYRLLRRFFIG